MEKLLGGAFFCFQKTVPKHDPPTAAAGVGRTCSTLSTAKPDESFRHRRGARDFSLPAPAESFQTWPGL